MADGLNQILGDPKFQALSPDAQKIVVGKYDPKFAALSPDAQGIALTKLMKPQPSAADLPGSTPLLRQLAPNIPSIHPTQFEQQRSGGAGILATAGQDIPRVVGNIGTQQQTYTGPVSVKGAGNTGEAQRQYEAEQAARQRAGYGTAYRTIAPIGQYGFGVNAPGMEQEAARGNMSGVIGHTVVPTAAALTPLAAEGLAKGAGALTKPIKSRLAPSIVRIEGVDMPVLAGEAEAPGTKSSIGKLQENLKRRGIGENEFRQIETQQQQAVKQVIKNVTQKATGAIGPMPEGAAGAVQQGADAVFQQARPMYQALDASLTHVPIVLDDLGAAAKTAIGRAQKLGVPITEPFNPTQPLQGMQAIRSELLKAASSSTDTAMRAALYGEASTVDSAIESALKNSKIPGLYDNWRQANALTKQGYALREVAQAVNKVTEGTPLEVQAGIGVQPVAPELKGAQLVKTLNQLDSDGTLARAYGEGYARSIRQVAGFLDRAQNTNIGRLSVITSGASEGSMIFRTAMKMFEKLGGEKIAQLMTDTKGAKLVANLTGATDLKQAVVRAEAVENFTKRLPAGVYQAGGPSVGTQGQLVPGQVKGLLPEGAIEGEYLPESAPPRGNVPRVAQAAPPSGPFAMNPPERTALPLPRQQALPPARSTQLANVSDSTAKQISRFHGYSSPEEVMLAMKNGNISMQLGDTILKRMKGKGASIMRPVAPPK